MSDQLDKTLVYLITKGEATSANFSVKRKEILQIIAAATDVGIPLIQIREKDLTAKSLFELVSEAAKITTKTNTKLLVNDRADIALAAKADGVHLTVNSLSAGSIRRGFPKNFMIGVSTHSLEEAVLAASQDADFVTFGPIFATPDKGEPKGPDELRRVCQELAPFPVIALGGINETNCQIVLDNGARGFAAIRYLNELYGGK